MKRFAGACLVLAAWGIGEARADGLAIALRLEGCDRLSESAVRRLVELELGANVQRREGPAPAPAQSRVDVRCTPASDRIVVDDGMTGKRLERALDVGTETPAAETRLLALSITELLAASWIELGMTGTRRPAPPAAKDAALAAAARRLPPAQIAGSVFASARSFDPGLALWGAGVAAATEGAGFGAAADVTYERGTRTVSLGRLSMSLVTLAPGATWSWRASRVALTTTLGARLGLAFLAGDPDAPLPGDPSLRKAASAVGAWAGPCAAEAITWQAGPVTLSFGLEAGLTVLGVGGLVADTREIAAAGPWLGARVGVGTAFR